MPQRTATRRKQQQAEHILAEQSVLVQIDTVRPYRKNPRVGNLPAIVDSLSENGQFRPIVVQKSTGEILGGNHTWKAAKSLGWEHIQAVYVDVDDEKAKRIVLADNRTNDLATYNTEVLAEILDSLPQADIGTGYSTDAIRDLMEGIRTQTAEQIEAVLRPTSPIEDVTGDGQPDLGVPFGQEQNVIDVEGQTSESGGIEGEQEPDPFKEASDQIKGAFGLKIDMIFEKVGQWHIPPLRSDMLVHPEDVPRNLLAWAGSATKDWPDDSQWWLYNYGIDSTSGMKDVSKAIVSFYCWDHYFESWWDYPDRYTAKMLNSGIKMVVTPDFSQWADDPRVVSLNNLYRNRWLGRYFQEAGIKVIPNISWRMNDPDYYNSVVRPTLPKKLPVIALQLQTWDDKGLTESEIKTANDFIQHVGESCDPELTIFYLGKQAWPVIEQMPWPGEKLMIRNRMDALAAQAKGRQKKRTI